MTDRVRTVDMSDPAVVLDCYKKLNVAYKELKAENEKLRAALKPFADEAQRVLSDMPDSIYWDDITVGMLRAAAAALKGTSDERRNRQATSDISRTPSS